MTDSSDCESDAGASPSVSSDESSSSSGGSSPSPSASTTKGDNTQTCKVNRTSSERKPVRKRQNGSNISNDVSRTSRSSRGSQSDNGKNRTPPLASTKKRKRSSPQSLNDSSISVDIQKSVKESHSSRERKHKRNKRRRTRSERNLLAGKSATTPTSSSVNKSQTAVTEGEEEVALDAEIDRVLEEKANKNNLSATNVKSIIRHVITNNMVQKMIMSSAMKKKAEAADAGGSSDEDCLVGPKMTRAKAKELLLENRSISLWPNVYSPVKIPKVPVSETHMLIHHDLPEDSSGDEEYIPKEADISGMIHSGDESSSVTSHASDIGSPSPATPKQRVATRRSLQSGPERATETSLKQENIFKTPAPRPGSVQKVLEESYVSRRTRSKNSLKDTPLEDLEGRLVAPDFEPDMYDFGTETDNEDYLNFLQEFLKPVANRNEANEVDDEADPEYNVMEDEDVHDREELRMDRAVKVPKKELTQLIAELFEPGMLSGDDMEDHDLATLTGITPLVNDTINTSYADESVLDSSVQENSIKNVKNESATSLVNLDESTAIHGMQRSANESSLIYSTNSPVMAVGASGINGSSGNCDLKQNIGLVNNISLRPGPSSLITDSGKVIVETSRTSELSTINNAQLATIFESNNKRKPATLFSVEDLKYLQHQMRQHIQLLAQSYILTVSTSTENAPLQEIAKKARGMVIELKNFARSKSVSVFEVCNLEPAWNLVNFWPHKFLQQSPIKKKILEEKYISESGVSNTDGNGGKVGHFPRHVVKIMAENPTFLYNELLPECYFQNNIQQRCTFNFHEDVLLVGALEELKSESKMSTAQKARMISEYLLSPRPHIQLFHRIRNLRKSSTVHYCDPAIKEYFAKGIVPPAPSRSFTEITSANAIPLLRRDKEGLSKQWQCLIQNFTEASTYKWDEVLNRDPVTKSIQQKFSRQNKGKQNGNGNQSSSPEPTQTIDNVFPSGTYQIENTNPDLEAFPLLNAQGKPGAIIYIPKKYLPKSKVASPVKPYTVKREAQTSEEMLVFQPREAQQAEDGFHEQQNIQGASSSNLNILGIQHLIQRSQKTPLKNAQTNSPPDVKSPIVTAAAVPVFNRPPQTPVRFGCHVVQRVGRPFNLNELGCNISVDSNDQVIDLSTLQTPLKTKIFQKATAMEVENENSNLDVSQTSGCESPNVIMEGTEVELTSSDEEDDIDTEPSTRIPPDVVDISSDEDDDIYATNVAGGSEGAEEKSSSKKTENDSNSNSTKQSNEASSSGENRFATPMSSQVSSSSRKLTLRPGKGEDSDDDNERRGRKRSLPSDCNKDESSGDVKDNDNCRGNSEKEKPSKKHVVVTTIVPGCSPGSSQKVTPSASTSSQQQQPAPSNNTKSQQHKKARRSPGNPQVSHRRASKYNVAPEEKLLEDTQVEFEDAADAYMEAYLAKVLSETEKQNPGLYTTFIQMLLEAGNGPVNQLELHAKVKVLFKDYPALLGEFECFLEPTLETHDGSNVAGTSSRHEMMTQIDFLQKIEKLTENCPQLKAKVLNKLKSLKEKPNLSQKDISSALENFFVANSVMMEAFKALLPEVYRPQSTSSGMDFEEIELDMEDPPRESSEELHFETVKLPDETTIPATNTCPCVCHTKTSDPSFASRSKHCRKCSLKFQDGKVFIHNGRVLRPVSVELTSTPTKQGASSSSSAILNRSSNIVANPESRTKKESQHHSSHSAKMVEFKEPESCIKNSDKKSHSQSSFKSSLVSKDQNPTETGEKEINPRSSQTTKSEEKLGGGSSKSSNDKEDVTTKVKLQAGPSSSSSPSSSVKQEVECPAKWTVEEDTIILTACKQDGPENVALTKMATLLPHRRFEQVKARFKELMDLLTSAAAEED